VFGSILRSNSKGFLSCLTFRSPEESLAPSDESALPSCSGLVRNGSDFGTEGRELLAAEVKGSYSDYSMLIGTRLIDFRRLTLKILMAPIKCKKRLMMLSGEKKEWSCEYVMKPSLMPNGIIPEARRSCNSV